MSLSTYKNYRQTDSRLGAVPAHWTVKRLRFAAKLNPTKSELSGIDRATVVSFLPMEAIGEDGSLNLENTRRIEDVETGYTYFRDGDVTIAKITPCFENGKGAQMMGLLGGIGFGTTELIVARPITDVSISSFLYFLFSSPIFRQLGEAAMYGAGGQKRVPEAFVRDYLVALPPVKEQEAIATFLDQETIKIDALVTEQRRLIELLKEKRQATISQAITKGLNPDVPMKDSGVNWLGKVPIHWEIWQSRRLFSLRNERARSSDRQLTASQEHGVIYQEDFVRLEGRRVVQVIIGADILKHVEPNDFVISMRSFQGGIEYCQKAGCISSAYVMLVPGSRIHCGYFAWLFKSTTYIQALQTTTNLVRDGQALRFENFTQVPLPLLPIDEQAAISAFLDLNTEKFDQLIKEANRTIELLRERRTALVSAVVGGEINVTQMVTS